MGNGVGFTHQAHNHRLRSSEREKNLRNPKWHRDELILALDLYFRHPPNHISKSHPEVIKLSSLLNELPLFPDRPDKERFRNPNGVYMKLCNFLRLDPSYKGTGLSRGGKDEEVVWDAFADNRALLKGTADTIRSGYSLPEVQKPKPSSEATEEEEDFPEGKVIYRLHKAYERSQSLKKRKKKNFKEEYGHLFCQACGFDFGETYGDIGTDFIECHHTKPLSELTTPASSRAADLALVCSNCHRMIHRRRPWLGMNGLKSLFE